MKQIKDFPHALRNVEKPPFKVTIADMREGELMINQQLHEGDERKGSDQSENISDKRAIDGEQSEGASIKKYAGKNELIEPCVQIDKQKRKNSTEMEK